MDLFGEICMTLGAFIMAVTTAIGIGWFTGRRTKFAKFRKRVLSLENEMLANHATILSLEKRISEVQKLREQEMQNNGHAVYKNGHSQNGHSVHNNGHTIRNNGHM